MQHAVNILHFLHTESALQPKGLLHTRGMAASGFPPPVWLIILSDQLEIVALVGRYPTN